MTKERCRQYLESAMVALEDMMEALDKDTPDAVLSFLEAAQDVHDSVSRAMTDAVCAIVRDKSA